MKTLTSEPEKRYRQKRKNLEDDFLKGGMNGLELAHNFTAITDELIQNILKEIDFPKDTAIIAVGGYGRQELAPFSDIDLWFLTRKTKDEALLKLVYRLWDMGLKVSYSVESPAETCSDAQNDLTVMTTLISARFLGGEENLYRDFKALYERLLQDTATEFVENKLAEQKKRHDAMGHSRYLLEPNLKEGCGGLRDLNMLEWIGTAWDFTKPDAQRFQRAKIFLLTARAFLHLVAGRPEEILSFAYQQQIAPLMGYTSHPGASAEDRLMKHYYLITREIRELTASLLAMRENSPHKVWFSEPMEALRFLENRQQSGEALSPLHLKQIAEVSGKSGRLRKNPEAAAILVKIITSKNNPEYILRIINETGMLARILPEFRMINARPQRDIYHIYTVDEHSLKTLGFINSFRHSDDARAEFLTEAAKEIKDWKILSLAAFLHDIGKNGFTGHAETGACLAMQMADTLALDSEESEATVWLVRNHLIMNNTAFHRDLSAKETIDDFAAKCGNTNRLNMLMLLSVADLMAVAPNVWTSWKASLLEDLYRKCKLILEGGALPPPEDVEALVRKMRDKAAKEKKPFAVMINDMPDIAASKVTVYAMDRTGLVAAIVGALAVSGASVISARITTNKEKEVLDTFLIQEIPGRYNREQKPKAFSDLEKIAKLKKNLEAALENKVNHEPEIKKRLGKTEKPSSILEKRILIDNKASALYSIIDVNCLDRRGFLYFIASKLTELKLNIVSAYITTYGNRVVDTFYTEEIGGGKITDEKRLEEVKRELYKVLDFD